MEGICRKGVKRKFEEEDDKNYAKERKTIIDMSMGKLRTNPSWRHEPCLRRSVLILNTLKHIELELAQEGIDSHQSTEAAMNEIPEMSTTQLTLDPIPDTNNLILPLPASHTPIFVEHEVSQVDERETSEHFSLIDSAIVDLLPCKPVFGCQDKALSQTSSPVCYLAPFQCPASSPLTSAFFTSAVFGSRDMSPLPVLNYEPALDIVPSLPLLSHNMLPNPVLELTKLYNTGDNNHVSQGPSTMGSSSCFGEDCFGEAELIEFLHSLQDVSDSMSPGSSASSSASVISAQCSTYCRTDSALDELDTIMQIIVGN